MALRNYNTREENEMQDLTQKQIDLAGFSEKGFSQEQINQIYEYAQMVGDELKVRNLIWSIAGANDQSDQERIVQLMEDARKEMEIYPDSEVTMVRCMDMDIWLTICIRLAKKQHWICTCED